MGFLNFCSHFCLSQKERDLELAARIGQSLLKKNKTLTERNELLEEQVEHIREEVRRWQPLQEQPSAGAWVPWGQPKKVMVEQAPVGKSPAQTQRADFSAISSDHLSLLTMRTGWPKLDLPSCGQ